MDTAHGRQVPAALVFDPRRFRAALALKGASIESVARNASLTSSHVWRVVSGRRQGSPALVQTIRDTLGAAGWLFATGETDTLRDERSAGEVAHAA